jgi:hypothetical protein
VIIAPQRRQINLLSQQARGLVGFWPLDEKTGNVAKDYSLSKNNATNSMVPGISYIGGVSQSTLYTNQAVSSSNIDFSVSTNWTISLWANIHTRGTLLNSYQTLFTSSRTNIRTNGNGNDGLFQSAWQRSNGDFYWTTYPDPPLNKITHVVLVIENDNIRGVYYNGNQVGSSGVFWFHVALIVPSQAIIGGASSSITMDEYISDVRIYNRALSNLEIRSLYVNPDGIWQKQGHCPLVWEAPWLSIAAATCDPTAPALALTSSALLTLASIGSTPIANALALSNALAMLLADIAENPTVPTVTIQQAVALLCVDVFGSAYASAATLSSPFLSIDMATLTPTTGAMAIAQALWLVIADATSSPSAPSLLLQLALAIEQATSTPTADTLEMTRAIQLLISQVTGIPHVDAVALTELLIGIGKLVNPNLAIATSPLILHSATPTRTIKRI